MRLIDADALQREYMQFHDGKRSVLVDVAPTIEPERKKGKWIVHDPCKRGLGKVYECSNCGEMVDCVIYKFCPNCGARMEGNDA